VQQRLQDGELFEEVARQFSSAPEAVNGGYIGTMSLDKMPDNIAQKLINVEIYSAPFLLQSEDKYIIVQRISPFKAEWWRSKIVDSSKADTTLVSPQMSPAAELKPYVLLSGVFHNRDYATERVAHLRALGLESFIQQRGSGPHLRYEVIAGRFAAYKTAESIGGKIVSTGLDYYIRNETK
jgi:hypothetical protein